MGTVERVQLPELGSEIIPEQVDYPKGRLGRLHIRSFGFLRQSEVWVVPEDGGEPIFLPCTEVTVTCKPGEYIMTNLTAARAKVDLFTNDQHGNPVRLVGDRVFHRVEVTSRKVPQRDVVEFRWSLKKRRGPRMDARLRLKRKNDVGWRFKRSWQRRVRRLRGRLGLL